MYNLYKKNQTRNPKKPFKYSDLMSDEEDIIFSSHSNDQSETSEESSDESEDDKAQSDELPNQNQEEYLKIEENVEIPNYAQGEVVEDAPVVSGKAKTDNMPDNRSNDDESSSDAFSRMEKSLKKLKQASDTHPKMTKIPESEAKPGNELISTPVMEDKSDKNDLSDSKSDMTEYSYYLIDPNVEHEQQRNRTPDVPEHEQERLSAPDVPPRKYRRL